MSEFERRLLGCVIVVAIVFIVFLCYQIRFMVNYDKDFGIKMGEAPLDDDVAYDQGILRARSDAHRFIKYRISENDAKLYYKWLAEPVHEEGK